LSDYSLLSNPGYGSDDFLKDIRIIGVKGDEE
jgi:hypothetical protein